MADGALPAAVPPGSRLLVCAEGLDGRALGCEGVNAGATSYSVFVSWFEPGPRAIRLHFLWIDESGGDVSFTGTRTLDATVADGGAITVNLVGAALPPATASVSASLTTAVGMSIDFSFVSVRLGGRSAMPLWEPTIVNGSFTLAVPRIGAQTLDLYAVAAGVGQGTLAWLVDVAPDSDVEFHVPSPAVLTAPPDAAIDVSVGTTFATSSGSGVHTFIFQSAASTFVVSTVERAITLSDLVGLGVTLPASTSFVWEVWTHGGSTTVEEAAEGWYADYYSIVSSEGHQGPTRDGSFSRSAKRSFTTAP
jgi:hypothetical protein